MLKGERGLVCSSQVQTRQRVWEPPVAARRTFRTPSAGPAHAAGVAGSQHAPCPGRHCPARAVPDPQQLLPGRRDPAPPRIHPRLGHRGSLPPPRPFLTSQPGVPSVSLPSAPPVSGATSRDPPRPCLGPSLPRGARALCPRSGAGGTAPGDAARPSRRCRRTQRPRPCPAAAPAPLPRGSPCRGLHLPGSQGAGAAAGGAARALPLSRPPPQRCGGAAHAPPSAAHGAAQGAGRARRSRAAPRGPPRDPPWDRRARARPAGAEPIPGLRGPGGKRTGASRPPAVPRSGRRCRRAGKRGPRPHAAPPGRGSPAPARPAERRGERAPPWGGRAEPRETGRAARGKSPATGTSPGGGTCGVRAAAERGVTEPPPWRCWGGSGSAPPAWTGQRDEPLPWQRCVTSERAQRHAPPGGASVTPRVTTTREGTRGGGRGAWGHWG